MSNQLNKLQEKDINLTSKCHSMEISLGELRETKDALESKLITTDTALKDSDVKVFNITVHRDQLLEENEMFKMKLEALKKTKSLSAISQVFDAKVNDLQYKHKNFLNETIYQLKESLGEKSKFEEENSELKDQIQIMKLRATRIESEQKLQLKTIREKLITEQEKYYQEKNQILYENAKLEGIILGQNIKIHELNLKLEKQNDFDMDYFEDIETLRAELEAEHAKHDLSVRTALSHLSTKNLQLEADLSSLHLQLQQSRTLQQNTEKQLQYFKTSSQESLMALNEKLSHLTYQLDESNRKNQKLKNTLENLKKRKEYHLDESTSPPPHLEYRSPGVVLY